MREKSNSLQTKKRQKTTGFYNVLFIAFPSFLLYCIWFIAVYFNGVLYFNGLIINGISYVSCVIHA